jgi:hypothetical protein
MSGVDEELKSLDNTHNPSGVPDSGFGKYPDDVYIMRLDKIRIEKAKKGTGRLQCVWEFEIIQGDYASRKHMKFSGMDTADGLDFLTRDFRTAGITTFKWTNVHEQFSKILDKLFQVQLKSNVGKDDKVYQSTYIQKVINPDDVMVSKALSTNDDVPF